MPTSRRFALEAVYAGKGDALILHHGTVSKPRWMLIDGGHRRVYADYLRPRLDELRLENTDHLTDGKIPLDLVMVSHADADHVQGLLDLKRHIEADSFDHVPLDEPAVDIKQFWVNGFDDLAFGGEAKEKRESDTSSIVASGSTLDDEQVWIASTAQCRELRDFAIGAEQIEFNDQLEGDLVRRACPGVKDVVTFPPGLKMTILGPDEKRVQELRKQWKGDLAKLLAPNKTNEASFTDRSRHNLASIMVMVERGKKRMLLTGDGRGDHLVDGLREQGFLRDGRVEVDLFKVPHHGSSRNVEQDTFETIIAKNYVISANGEHDNPDREMLDMLANGREQADPGMPYNVYFTFPERAFEAISVQQAETRRGLARQRAALLDVHDWLTNDRPATFVPVYRERERFSVTVDLLP